MPQDPFPDPGPDDEEPDNFPPEQGLFITLPAEQLTLTGFAQGGEADTMAPGPLLATIVDTVTGEDGTGLAGCSDDQLMGIISAARRQQARDEWIVLAAVGEFARRAGTGVEGEFAADELGPRAAHDPALRGRADGLRHHRGPPAAEVARRAARRSDQRVPAADHRGRNPHPVRPAHLVPAMRGRAWPPWSPSPSRTRPCSAGPTPPAKLTGLALWTATTPSGRSYATTPTEYPI
jgi:hypothetical protein